ncbi:MAG: flagellar biosynthesis protein FlgD [Rhodoferax sp.]|nr:flagellar biosynthesis protein FlgD [Rhodoferax sp.]
MAITGVNGSWGSTAATATNNTSDPAAAQDRFLKLLVAQLNNQDPMNPMDNAEMTSQIAQINTVTGIQQLNTTIKGMADQFTSLQVMQGGAMVGRTVLTEGDKLTVDSTTKTGSGSFDLSANAADVNVQVSTAGGQVLGTVKLGGLEAGRHSFEYDTSGYTGTGALNFKVVANNASTVVDATALMQDKVVSVGAENGALKLQLEKGGSVAYSAVKAIL